MKGIEMNAELLKHELEKADKKYRSANIQLWLAAVWMVFGILVCFSDLICGGAVAVTGILAVVLMLSQRSTAKAEVEELERKWRNELNTGAECGII